MTEVTVKTGDLPEGPVLAATEMKIKRHTTGDPMPAGWRSFVHLETTSHGAGAPGALAKVSTAAPQELIDRQIEENTLNAGLPFILAPSPAHGRRMALVCFGPSLMQTWEELKGFGEDTDIWTCSGGHKFLRERGIAPAFHTECEARPHKAHFLENPCPSTTFVLASRVSKEMLAHVRGLDVRLFHMDIEAEYGVIERVGPKGVPLVPCATTNGMSALPLGLFLGYRRFVVFGMDGSFAETEHAGYHPNSRAVTGKDEHQHFHVEIDGRTFETSMLHLLALQDFFNIALPLPEVEFEFRGDAMIPWAINQSKRKAKEANDASK